MNFTGYFVGVKKYKPILGDQGLLGSRQLAAYSLVKIHFTAGGHG